MTVLFLDIKSFTTMAERLSPVEIFNLVNTLMSYLDPAILKNSGLIDKYIGDAIMALFNDPDDAVVAALDMLEALKSFNATRVSDNLPPISVGIGINTGNLIVGTVGFEKRMDCSVISDAVNTASRLETLTRSFNIELIIGEETYEQLKQKDEYDLRFLGLTTVKGKSLPIKIYEVFNHNLPVEVQFKKDSASIFASALDHYEAKQFDEAASLFEQIIISNPNDLPAKYFLQQCKEKIN